MTSKAKSLVVSTRGRNKEAGRVDVIVGQRLRLRRTVLQLSLPDLAEKIGIAQQQLQKYETGQNRVSASRLHDLSVALKVPVGWFFEDIPAGTAVTLATMAHPTASRAPAAGPAADVQGDALILLTCYKSITDNTAKDLLLAMARFLSRSSAR